MQKLQDYWNERSSQQKIILAAAFLATFLVIAGFGWMASRPGMSMIYGGLDSAQAGEVVAGIERAGVTYEVRGDSIWVDTSARDRLRMELAAQGLPAQGTAAIRARCAKSSRPRFLLKVKSFYYGPFRASLI